MKHQTSIIRNSALVARELEDELLILDFEKGRLYTLNSVGRNIWEYIKTKKSLRDIVNFVQKKYALSSKKATHDVREFIEMALKDNLLIVVKT